MSRLEAVPLFLVDAFAERPFAGNPAAVCLLPAWPSDRWLADVAAEMNQSETAFVVPAAGTFDLRWFTPTVEVDLCGHATLAAAFVLWRQNRVAANSPIQFSTRSGILSARHNDAAIELDFPLEQELPAVAPDGLAESLGVMPRYVGRSRFDYLVEVDDERAVRAIWPDFAKLASVACRGVIVTARAEDHDFDFVSRFFAPAAGINEDPVTGSAHCTLAHFWRTRLQKSQFKAFQASRRGGVVEVRIAGERVGLGGSAVLVASGTLAGDLSTS